MGKATSFPPIRPSGTALLTRSTVGLSVLRDRAPVFVPLADGSLRNGYTLKIANNPLSIVPSSTYNGMTTAQGMLTTYFTATAPVPEPSTVVLFSATIAGLGFRHRLRRARAAG